MESRESRARDSGIPRNAVLDLIAREGCTGQCAACATELINFVY
jgi:hypothetical protein